MVRSEVTTPGVPATRTFSTLTSQDEVMSLSLFQGSHALVFLASPRYRYKHFMKLGITFMWGLMKQDKFKKDWQNGGIQFPSEKISSLSLKIGNIWSQRPAAPYGPVLPQHFFNILICKNFFLRWRYLDFLFRDFHPTNRPLVDKTCRPVGANFSRPVLIFGQTTWTTVPLILVCFLQQC